MIVSKVDQRKLIEFVKTHKDLDDTEFHNYAESLGYTPHEAEEVIYKYVWKVSKDLDVGKKLAVKK